MKKLLLPLLAFLTLCVGVQAEENRFDEAFAVQDVEIEAGGKATMTFELTKLPVNGSRGFEFHVYLPDGFSLELKSNGRVKTTVESPNSEEGNWSISGNPQTNPQDIKFMGTSTDGDLLVEGPVFSVTLKANANVANGIYHADVAGETKTSDFIIQGKNGGVSYLSAPFKIRIFVPRLELSEDKNYPEGFDEGLTNVNVTMNTRTLKANTWNTICLPFGMDRDQIAAAFPDNNVTIAELTGCTPNADNTHLSLKFTSISADAGIEANKPYLIKVSTGVTTFTVNGTSFAALDAGKDNPEVEVDGCKFIGNYTNLSNLDKVIFISGNKFYVAQGSTSLKSFRGYFTHQILESSGNANVSLFVDDEPTGISTLTTNQDSNNIYDISGRKVNSDKTTLQKGIYITNGKKETVR